MKVNTDGVLLGAAVSVDSLPEHPNVLDIGCGTGTISLMLAQRLSGNAYICGIDIDEASGDEASMNFSNSPWKDSLRAEICPLQEYKPQLRFDLIVSNPPYFEASLKNPDARKADARHTDSLSYREIINFAQSALSENGRLAMILPADNESSLLRYARSWSLYPCRLLRIKTSTRKQVSRIIFEFSRKRAESVEDNELVIMKEGRYTSEYIALVSDFYINL